MSSLPSTTTITFPYAQKAAWEFLRVHWLQLLLLVVSLFILSVIAGILLALIVGGMVFAFSAGKLTVGTYLFSVIGGMITAWILFTYIIGTWFAVSFSEYVANNYRGNKINFWSAIKKGWQILAKSFGTMLIHFLCLGACFVSMLLVSAVLYSFVSFYIALSNSANLVLVYILNSLFLLIPFLGTWMLALYLSFTMYAVVTPGKYYFPAVFYSISLIKGKWWKLFGYHMFYTVITLLIVAAYYLLMAVTKESAVLTILITLLYYIITLVISLSYAVCMNIVFLHFSGQNTPVGIIDTESQDKKSSHFVRMSVICLLLIALAGVGTYSAADTLQPLLNNFTKLIQTREGSTSGSVLTGGLTTGDTQGNGVCMEGYEEYCKSMNSQTSRINSFGTNAQINSNQNQEYHPNRIYHDKE
ncbi:MAG: hypothetical protein ACK4NC_05580 [Candidatus Gracilibacteria bacterium]